MYKRRTLIALVIIAFAAVAGALVARGWSAEPVNPLRAGNAGSAVVVLDPSRPFALEPPPAGWRHRRFWFTSPMQLSFTAVDGVPALRCETNAGGSIYGRNADIELSRFPLLIWRWRVDVPIPSSHDERIREGDDHPVRWFVAVRDTAGGEHRFEIIWSNGAFKRGDYKYIGEFAHYVADGGAANIGVWRDERADLLEIYQTVTKRTDAPRLTHIAIFCDSDNTRTRSVAYVGETRLQAK
jgi:hypothetical protein